MQNLNLVPLTVARAGADGSYRFHLPLIGDFRGRILVRRHVRLFTTAKLAQVLESARDFFTCRFLAHRGLDIGARTLLPYSRFIADRRFFRSVGGSHGDCILPH